MDFKNLTKIDFKTTHTIGTYKIKRRRFISNTQKKRTQTIKATLKFGDYLDGEGYHDNNHYGFYFTYRYFNKETKKYFEQRKTLPDMLHEAISITHIK